MSAAVLVDTGVLVALFDRSDKHHAAAKAWMANTDAQLVTVASVLVETSFFLPPALRASLAGLASRGVLLVRSAAESASGDGLARIAQLFAKYADQDPDWADMELVWLAETIAVHHIATLDVADFSAYRIHGRKRFELALLR